jgi:hypothetical protein
MKYIFSDGREGKMKKVSLFIVLWLLFCFGMLCPADVILDLSKNPGRIESIPVSANIDQIYFQNFIPAMFGLYKIKVEVQEFVPSPLPSPTRNPKKNFAPDILQELINDFVSFNQSNVDAEWENSEKIIIDKYDKIQAEVKKPDCKNNPNKPEAEQILQLQKRIIGGPFIMNEGDQISITVTRGKYTWTYSVYRPHGEWLVSYGFSFVSPLFFKPDKFFITNNPDDEKTFLLKQSSRKGKWYDLEFVPSVFFWWMPAKARKVNIAPTAGLGFDMQSPVVFAGAALVYNYNIGVNFGFVFHKLNYLKDRYAIEDKDGNFPSAGSVIKENLSDDQLYDSKYRFNLFLSVTFRFGSNPFASGAKQPEVK